jgi:SAM-dependent methyltransferase
MRLASQHLDPGATGLYARIWQLLPHSADLVVLDVGCAEGALTAARPSDRAGRVVGVDRSAVMLARHPRPAIRADATALPFATGAVTAVTAVNMLYHLDEPLAAIREARRVLAADGVFVTATISGRDSPELERVWRPEPSTFDAEDAAAIVGEVFSQVEAEWWDAPLITLPDKSTVRDYLVARWVPPGEAAAAANTFDVPLTVTKRGVLIVCRD